VAALTTTSYAILGLLNLRSYSAYELASQSQRSLRFVWPTAPSRLYAEPKRLATEGLIEIAEEAAGPTRTRQVYRITPAGRRALKVWLKTEPAVPVVEAEVLLRVLFGDAGRDEDLGASLRATVEQVMRLYDEGMLLVEEYGAGNVAFPERLHLNMLWIVYVRELLLMTRDWATFAEAEMARWHTADDRGQTARATELVEMLVRGESPLPSGRSAPVRGR
jgi:PadR family transcriptional regulator, regulatory protein AphA